MTMKSKTALPPKTAQGVINNIRTVREMRGLTQEALAQKLGTSAAQVNRLEKSVRKLTIEWLLKLCAALDATADEIVDLPLSRKAGGAKCDQALMGTVLGALLEITEKQKTTPSRKELTEWSTYVYNEAIEKKLNLKQTLSLAEQVVKISRRFGK